MHRRFGSVILDTVIRFIIPFLLLFAIYVLVHGHYSPGGGFQAGTLLAISVILVRAVQGPGAEWGLRKEAAVILASLGAFIYAGIGLLPLFFGGNVLDYGVLPLGMKEAKVRALATLGVEIGVTLTVMGVFIVFYDLLTSGPLFQGEQDRKED